MASDCIAQTQLPLEGGTDERDPRPVAEWLGPLICSAALCYGVDREPNEEWRRSRSSPHIWTSSHGRMTSIGKRRSHPARIVGTCLHNGYAYAGDGARVRRVARFVCETWNGPAPFAGAQVRHLDGNSRNDQPENLAWGSAKDNVADAIRHGTHPRGSKTGTAKLTEEGAAAILIRRHLGETQAALAAAFALNRRTLRHITHGHTWKHVLPDLIRPDAGTKARGATLRPPKRKTPARRGRPRSTD